MMKETTTERTHNIQEYVNDKINKEQLTDKKTEQQHTKTENRKKHRQA